MSFAPTAPPALTAPPAGLPGRAAVLGRAGGENFTVASRLLGPRARGHLIAFYGWARLVDEVGDNLEGDRVGALDWLEVALVAAVADPAASVPPLVAEAAAAVRALGMDPSPLLDLIAANRQDQVVTGYATFADLLGYCRLSADPVGRMVLAAFGCSTPGRVTWSDCVCSALQIVEHCGDVAEDRAVGRIYLPADDMARFGVADDDLRGGAGPAREALRGLLGFEAARARRMLLEGSALVGDLSGRSRVAVAGFVAGGLAAIDALAAAGFDPLGGAPRPRGDVVARHMASLLRPRW